MSRFFVTGLMRSRTAWLANYLTWGDSICPHDMMGECDSFEQFACYLKRLEGAHVGYSDPALLFVWEKVVAAFPQARWIVVTRAPDDVKASLRRLMGKDCDAAVERMQKLLEGLVTAIPATIIPFDEIDDRLDEIRPPGLEMPLERTRLLRRMNVQLHDFMTEVDRYKRKDLIWVQSLP